MSVSQHCRFGSIHFALMVVVVVQESLLAKEALTHCGRRTMPFDDILEALGRIICESSKHERTLTAKSFRRLTLLMTEWLAFRLPVAEFGSVESILRMFYATRSKLASGPRDQIHAQLGYLPVSVDINPDYNMAVAEVYRSSTLRVMQWSNSLNPLLLIHSGVRSEFPSWVADYRSILDYVRPHSNACPSLAAFVSERGSSELVVHGLVVDTIQRAVLDSKLHKPHAHAFEEIVLMKARIMHYLAESRPTMGLRIDSDRTTREYFWRTLCNDIVTSHNSEATVPDEIDSLERVSTQKFRYSHG